MVYFKVKLILGYWIIFLWLFISMGCGNKYDPVIDVTREVTGYQEDLIDSLKDASQADKAAIALEVHSKKIQKMAARIVHIYKEYPKLGKAASVELEQLNREVKKIAVELHGVINRAQKKFSGDKKFNYWLKKYFEVYTRLVLI